MNQELLEKAKQFEIDFLDPYPTVEEPSKLIADFAAYLNQYKLASTEHVDAINSVLILLTNSDLEKFAEAGEHVQGADQAVYGDKAYLAGLKEEVRKLITDIE